jgi:hypothetical protein
VFCSCGYVWEQTFRQKTWIKTGSGLLATIFYECLEGIFKISTTNMVSPYNKLIAVMHYFSGRAVQVHCLASVIFFIIIT